MPLKHSFSWLSSSHTSFGNDCWWSTCEYHWNLLIIMMYYNYYLNFWWFLLNHQASTGTGVFSASRWIWAKWICFAGVDNSDSASGTVHLGTSTRARIFSLTSLLRTWSFNSVLWIYFHKYCTEKQFGQPGSPGVGGKLRKQLRKHPFGNHTAWTVEFLSPPMILRYKIATQAPSLHNTLGTSYNRTISLYA